MMNETTAPHIIAAIGEVLWDVFPTGARFGGAPANFACSVAGLGRDHTRVEMVSAVGHDQLGVDALAALTSHGVGTGLVEQLGKTTGKVLIELDASGSASYEFAADCAWDNLSWSERAEKLAGECDVVCFGTLGQRSLLSRRSIQQFVRGTRSNALRIFDINLRPPFYSDDVVLASLELANVLKLNDEELPLLTSLCELGGTVNEQLRKLMERWELAALAMTRGAAGAVLLRGGELHECEGLPTEVVDTVGAGDAFTAALALGLLQKRDLGGISESACRVASYVCSQSGATPELPAFFRG